MTRMFCNSTVERGSQVACIVLLYCGVVSGDLSMTRMFCNSTVERGSQVAIYKCMRRGLRVL